MSPDQQLRPYLELACRAAREAGAVIMRRLRTELRIDKKGPVNFVTEVDIEAERIILGHIHEAYPDHAFLAEERGAGGAASTYKWLVDPLDGTTNYAHGYPIFCSSIALEIGGELAVGVTYDPVADELFSATQGGGAFLNDEPMHVSTEDQLGESLLATGFSYDQDAMRRNVENFGRFMNKAAGVRRDGSAARDLAYLAAGRFDGVWELKLNPWDLAAGFLLITEAGGRISGFRGQPVTIYDREIILSNGRIHEAMRAVLNA